MPTCPTCGAIFDDDAAECVIDGTPLEPDDTEAAPAPPLGPGSVIGGTIVSHPLGAGAFGEVYAARRPDGADLAIKVLLPLYSSNAEVVARFFGEARAVQRLDHPNIVTVHGHGRLDDGRAYLVMEQLVGTTLKERLAHGPLPHGEALNVLGAIARALDAAHAQQIAHRDLKPDNIFLNVAADGSVVPKLLDFGVAKLLDGSAEYRTATGMPMGTPAYMSPEQWRGRYVDQRADLFALGIVAFEVFSGRRPFTGTTAVDLMVQSTTEAPDRLSAHGLPAELDAPLLHMLEKDPGRRPASASAAIAALARAL